MTHGPRTLEWPEVARFYEEQVTEQGQSFEPMLALVQFLASSRYASALFPCVSDDLLRIGRVRDFTPGDNELQIKFDGLTKRFEFRYLQRPDDPRPWSRECEASEWPAVLDRVLHKRLDWFHEG